MFGTKRTYSRKPSHTAPTRFGRRGQASRGGQAGTAGAGRELAAFWAFNERGGWSVENLAGPEAHLSVSTLGQVTWVPKVGQGLVRGDGCVARCSGSAGGYLTAGNPTNADVSGNAASGYSVGWSFLIRFRFVALPGTASGVFSIGDTSAATNPGYLLQLSTPTTLRVLIGDSAYQALDTNAAAGVWYTVVSTSSGQITNASTVTETHYLNGRQVYTGSVTCGTSKSANVYVGSGFNGVTNIDVDVVALANRGWTSAEAKAYSENPWLLLDAGRTPRGLKAGAGGGTTTTDVIGGGCGQYLIAG